MTKSFQLYNIVILAVSLSSCNGQNQTDQASRNLNQAESGFIENIYPIQKLDTIWSINAPSRITRKIRKDNDNNLIFAAYDDIIRYDGESFTKMTKEDGLASFNAFDVWEDKTGRLWIASTLQGVFQYHSSTDIEIGRNTNNHYTTENGLAHIRSMCIYEDKAGGIWIGTEDGISYNDGKPLTKGQLFFRNFTNVDGLTNSNINTITEDKSGKIWVGTRGNLAIYDPVAKVKSGELPFSEVKNEEGKPFHNIWSIIEDKHGNIWLGGENGLWRYNGDSFINLSTINVMAIHEDKKGNVWFTHQGGFSRFDQKSLLENDPKATPIFIGKGMFFGINEDKDGNIWVGNLDAVLRYDGKSISYFFNGIANRN